MILMIQLSFVFQYTSIRCPFWAGWAAFPGGQLRQNMRLPDVQTTPHVRDYTGKCIKISVHLQHSKGFENKCLSSHLLWNDIYNDFQYPCHTCCLQMVMHQWTIPLFFYLIARNMVLAMSGCIFGHTDP